jgi:hypothetical protein
VWGGGCRQHAWGDKWLESLNGRDHSKGLIWRDNIKMDNREQGKTELHSSYACYISRLYGHPNNT